ncbi:uncharacterized protein NFIA_062290 [Aspergillus fischeri NRRL 181]|uniref:Uncharacterized protein n=1 Tax=Neosartorya fischeri (strain ATCC 1020 / DSM 3700 / CBS 544.65 / FGSC A1164 / JCM 1740 / NRRL 181 / WB 181) TaxID=331117 RepID=A1D5S4_NEOFI|nr:uncharacterized protein NFIA_062290 [Aspergillus fischeri NRRL 181]EAW21068.1 hypothetical protein NFIA_062290 [Aspergillus fischeri NRRL 181]
MDNVDGLEEWPLTVRLEVAGSSKDLWESKKAGPSYNAFLATRRQELAGILPPAQNASAEAWAEFRSKKLLRTLPGDEGFVAWLQAKASFLERIVVVAREWGDAIDEVEGADGDGDSDGNSREASADYFERILRGDFPLELEEI